MSTEIELINDGDGVALIGDPAAIEHFLAVHELPSTGLGLHRLRRTLDVGSAVATAGSETAAASGRWVKLTERSARVLKQSDTLMSGSEPGVSRAVVMQDGRTKHILEIVKGPGTRLTNPAVLAGAAGLMAQLSMQQTMAEITDYLAAIDQKVDDVLRGQQDAALAEMVGVDFVVEEAMTIREQVGRVSEVTWSKVQATTLTIARTQAYALRQIDACTSKLERSRTVGDLADTATDVEKKVGEWLAVLARCFQLQDAIAVLELDRVLDASPEELDDHRRALRVARRNRLERIAASTEGLLARLDAAASTANTKVLWHPARSPDVVKAGTEVSVAVADFHGRLGIQHQGKSRQARRWVDAAADVRDLTIDRGAMGVTTAKRLGGDGLGRAKGVTGRVSRRIGERAPRLGRPADAADEPGEDA